MEIQKGTYQYIARQKKRKMIMILLLFVVAVSIYLMGLFLNKMDKANIFTVFAILVVLPWAKYVVALVVFFPFHSVPKERYDRLRQAASKGCGSLYTDLVITSTEKVMNLDFIYVGHDEVWLRYGKQGQDQAYIRQYLTKEIAAYGDQTVHFTDEDEAMEKAILADQGREMKAASVAQGEEMKAAPLDQTQEMKEIPENRENQETRDMQNVREHLLSLMV